MKKRFRFGIRPFSNLWHALWTTLAFAVSLTIWILEAVYDFGAPRGYENTSYVDDFLYMIPAATVLFALLASGLWIAWRRERKPPSQPEALTFDDLWRRQTR